MCGRLRTASHLTWRQIVRLYRVAMLEDEPVELSPTQRTAVVYQAPSGFAVERMSWGFHFDTAGNKPVFNLRIENVDSKFRRFQTQKVVLPVEAFFEWNGPPKHRIKYVVTSGDPMVFVGFWQQDGACRHFSILTKPAPPSLMALHDRAPVALTPEQSLEWFSLVGADTNWLLERSHSEFTFEPANTTPLALFT